MKTAAEALQILISSMRPITEMGRISVVDGLGRVLAEPVVSPIDVPAYDNSQMDGYAGVAVEMNNALDPLPVSQRIAAGHPGSPLVPGTVARIFTGAAIPSGANAVVMQEQTVAADEHSIRLMQPVAPGQNIRPKAGDLHRGQVILQKGRRLSAADIGLCASVGLAEVSVMRRLRVAVFSSGDELRQPGESLSFGQIYDSNRRMILALVQGAGCTPIDMGCLPDQFAMTRDRLQQAASQCDALLTCGGVSVGEEDHIKSAISALGTLDLWKVAIKPGKPFAFGRVGEAVFMGMPGNPVAAWVTFCLLIRPALLTLAGARVSPPIGSRRPAAFDWPQP
ncbi:MAG: molybdopterin molybdotransferase MoeA, partial [Betaproteobacteria bacterium]|nr:molybdopterin molybdotransferase MoeA [Betaproteobacteria bacterium]